MLENTWRESDNRLDILLAANDGRIQIEPFFKTQQNVS
jgi:hypothetical protein